MASPHTALLFRNIITNKENNGLIKANIWRRNVRPVDMLGFVVWFCEDCCRKLAKTWWINSIGKCACARNLRDFPQAMKHAPFNHWQTFNLTNCCRTTSFHPVCSTTTLSFYCSSYNVLCNNYMTWKEYLRRNLWENSGRSWVEDQRRLEFLQVTKNLTWITFLKDSKSFIACGKVCRGFKDLVNEFESRDQRSQKTASRGSIGGGFIDVNNSFNSCLCLLFLFNIGIF